MEYVELVVRSRAGDMDAYGELVKAYQDMAFGYAYSLLGDFHQAEDASQEAFIEGFRSVAAIREPGAWPGWLRRIVHRQCLRTRAGRKPNTDTLDAARDVASPDQQPDDAAVLSETRRQIATALRSLTQHERTTALLYYTGGYRQREIAEFLGTTTHVVKHRLRAARQKLRRHIGGATASQVGPLSLPAPSQDGTDADAVIQRLSREMGAGLATFAATSMAFGRMA